MASSQANTRRWLAGWQVDRGTWRSCWRLTRFGILTVTLPNVEQVGSGCERQVSSTLEVKWGIIIKGFHFEAELFPNPSLSLRRGHKHHVIILVY